MMTKNAIFDPKINSTHTIDVDLLEEQSLLLADNDLLAEAQLPGSATPTSVETKKVPAGCRYKFIPLGMGGRGGTHVVTEGSRQIIEDEVSLQDLQAMTELFYEKAFKDTTLDKFIHSHDDPHGQRFAKWIHQKLSGSTVWDDDRRQRVQPPTPVVGGHVVQVHDRSSAHVAAWHSTKRPASEAGRHFQLDEARVWMRLHFWAMRESGMLSKSPTFADYYVRFIAHFVRVYENTAPAFARDSLRWSADEHNIRTYLTNDRRMDDVLGLTLEEAEGQIPEEEANDFVWPYNKTQ